MIDTAGLSWIDRLSMKLISLKDLADFFLNFLFIIYFQEEKWGLNENEDCGQWMYLS